METIKVIKKHIEPKIFWKLPQDEQIRILQNLLDDLVSLYNVKKIKLKFDPDPLELFYNLTRGGVYRHKKREIVLYHKVSLMTFLHEFAHSFFPDEERAQLWSHKAFFLSFPKLYLKGRKTKKFLHNPPLEKVEEFDENFI